MENFSLYQITNAFPQLMAQDNISDEDKVKIEKELTEILRKKSNGIIAYTKNIELTIKAIKDEEKRLTDNRKALENKLVRFKGYVKECMEENGFNKIQTDLGTLTLAKSPISVEIIDENKIPKEYKQTFITTEINKKKIADDFKKTGELIEGVEIHTDNTNLRIK